MPERSILRSHSENSCTRYENKKLQHSPPLKFSLVPGAGRTPNPVDGVEAGAIFIAEGHFNLKPVLPLDAQEFNPQIGCVAGFNYGDYKKIELPDGKNGNTISGCDSTDLPSVLPAEKRRDAFLQSMDQRNPGKMSGAHPSSFTG
jgi:hypothetical protein